MIGAETGLIEAFENIGKKGGHQEMTFFGKNCLNALWNYFHFINFEMKAA